MRNWGHTAERVVKREPDNNDLPPMNAVPPKPTTMASASAASVSSASHLDQYSSSSHNPNYQVHSNDPTDSCEDILHGKKSHASHLDHGASLIETLHNDAPTHPDVRGPACDHCVRDYENDPGLVCKYEYAAGRPCERCHAKGYANCCKISLIDHNGQPRHDRQPIIDLQHMAAEVHRHNTAGEPVPQHLKDKFHLLQTSVTLLVKSIVDAASKERHLRRALRLEREANEAEKKRVEAQRRKVEREKNIATQQRSRAETAEKEVAEARQRRYEAHQSFEELKTENEQQAGEISWLRANNAKLTQQNQRNAANAHKKLRDELHNVRTQFNELDQHYRMLQNDAVAREHEKNDLQQKYIASKVEAGILKSELDKITAKQAHELRALTHELNEDRLKATERYQGMIAQLEWNTKKMEEELLDNQVKCENNDRSFVDGKARIKDLETQNAAQVERIAGLEASLRVASMHSSSNPKRPRLPPVEVIGQSFKPWNKLPVHIKALVIEYLVVALPSLSNAVLLRSPSARVSIPSSTHLARDPSDVIVSYLLEIISEDDAFVLKGYCNVSLDFRVSCIVAQAKLRVLAKVKIPSGMRTNAKSATKGDRRWEISTTAPSSLNPLPAPTSRSSDAMRLTVTERKQSQSEINLINRMVHKIPRARPPPLKGPLKKGTFSSQAYPQDSTNAKPVKWKVVKSEPEDK